MQFYDRHAAHRDKFEIVAFCIDHDGELKSLADLDRHLKPIVKNVWNGRQLPFPLLLDASFRTFQSFGIDSFGKMLIDPQGRPSSKVTRKPSPRNSKAPHRPIRSSN